MACGVEAEKNDKSFTEILEYLENEENVEIVSGHICNTESIYSLFILLSFFSKHSSMTINNEVHQHAVACLDSIFVCAKSKHSCLFKDKLKSIR